MAKNKATTKRHKPSHKKQVPKPRKRLAKAAKLTTKTLWHVSWVSIALILAFPIVLYAYWSTLDSRAPSGRPASNIHASQVATFPALGAHADCRAGTLLNIVAHEDDDLLFMNPAILHAIADNKCVRTVYVTAGDDGRSAEYWQGREQGAKAAYAAMRGSKNSWHDMSASLWHRPVNVSYLTPDNTISLVFLRLPDGKPGGTGFLADRTETLQELRTGRIKSIHTVDNATSYTANQLVTALSTIIQLDMPTGINTQAFGPNLARGDHSDHQAVGYFVNLARRNYTKSYTFTMYLGYQNNGKPANLSEPDIATKQAAFNAYENYDSAICITMGDCPNSSSYSSYIERQYIYQLQTVPARTP